MPSEKVLMRGSHVVGEAAVRAGCRFYAGYPITPQNELPEYLSWRLPEVGGTFIQAESEIASINMILGASAAGAPGAQGPGHGGCGARAHRRQPRRPCGATQSAVSRYHCCGLSLALTNCGIA